MIALATGLLPPVVLSSSSSAVTASTTFVPQADTYVNQGRPSSNFGTKTSLRTDAAPSVLRSYLRFNVTGLSGTITQATLRVYATSSNSTGVVAAAVADKGWDERAMSWSNAPVVGTPAGGSGSITSGTWAELDVTSLVKGTGLLSMALTSPSATAASLSAREAGANAPQLVVTVTQPTTTTTAPPATDVQPSFPIRGAFSYPWFPEAWNQQGMNPFTRYTPSAGFYDSSAATVITDQIQAMQYGGMDMSIASWWGQGTPTDGRVPQLLQGSAGTPFRWSLYFEPEGSSDPSVAQITLDLTYMRDRYGSDPSYLRVNGQFVVFVYADAADGCAMADRWTQANTVGAYVVLKVFPGYTSCASQPAGWHQYSPAVATDSQGTYSYAISPGFYQGNEATARLARDPIRWRQNIQTMAASNANFQLVTTFNEWGEGTSVESATQWASGSTRGTYLDALHDVLGSTGGTSPPPSTTTTTAPTTTTTTMAVNDPILLAAGDIASCSSSGDEATAALLNARPSAVVATLGDNVYDNGTSAEFTNCYNPSWGASKQRTYPSVGNHEYGTAGAAGYFGYFGAAAGDPTKGYYSYNVGAWHVVALNSNCSIVSCAAGSAQEQWLRADLAAHPKACTLAYSHHPRFSSGTSHGSSTSVAPLWQALYDNNADVVMAGHEHNYERFAPLAPSGQIDPARGIRSFVVGSGGRGHYSLGTRIPGSEVANTDTFGVLQLTLQANGYTWQFVPEVGKTFADAGSGSCH